MQSAYPMRSAQPRAQGVVRLAQGVKTSSSQETPRQVMLDADIAKCFDNLGMRGKPAPIL